MNEFLRKKKLSTFIYSFFKYNIFFSKNFLTDVFGMMMIIIINDRRFRKGMILFDRGTRGRFQIRKPRDVIIVYRVFLFLFLVISIFEFVLVKRQFGRLVEKLRFEAFGDLIELAQNRQLLSLLFEKQLVKSAVVLRVLVLDDVRFVSCRAICARVRVVFTITTALRTA